MTRARLFFLGIFLTTIAHAQEKQRTLELGFGAGVNCTTSTSQFSNMSNGTQVAQPGFSLGLTAIYGLSKRFFANAQVQYLEKKTKNTYDLFSSASLEMINNCSWVATPVQLNFILTPKLRSPFFIGGGFSPKRLIDSQRKRTITANGVGPLAGPISVQTQDWNFGATVQLGTFFQTNQNGKVMIILSYETSLNYLERNLTPPSSPYQYNYTITNIRLNSFSLGVSYIH